MCSSDLVITGFPGETDEQFMDTHDFLENLDISYIHAFTYSERENTPASTMPDAVPVSIRRERSNLLRELSANKKERHYRNHIGQTRSVLFEQGPNEKLISGFTDNYIRILMDANPGLINPIQEIKLESATSLKGELFIRSESIRTVPSFV